MCFPLRMPELCCMWWPRTCVFADGHTGSEDRETDSLRLHGDQLTRLNSFQRRLAALHSKTTTSNHGHQQSSAHSWNRHFIFLSSLFWLQWRQTFAVVSCVSRGEWHIWHLIWIGPQGGRERKYSYHCCFFFSSTVYFFLCAFKYLTTYWTK